MILTHNKIIEYSDLVRHNKQMDESRKRGIKYIVTTNKFKKILGIICIVIAILPNGLGFIFLPLGLYLYSIHIDEVRYYFKHKLFMARYKRGLL